MNDYDAPGVRGEREMQVIAAERADLRGLPKTSDVTDCIRYQEAA